MTNFQAKPAGRRPSPQQVLLWGPVALGLLLAAAALAALLWPALQQLQRHQQQLVDLRQQEARLPLLRRQLDSLRQDLADEQRRGETILRLIAGSGEISTFLAQLGQEARRSGVQLDSFEPLPAATATRPDPLQAPGLQKRSLLITARGTGLGLQAFLRRLERLSLLVVQSDLALKDQLTSAPSGTGKPAGAATSTTATTTLRLNLTLYAKGGAAEPPAQPRPRKRAPGAGG